MDLPNHKATSWAQFNLAVSGVCMCVYVCRTNLFKYRSKQLLILRCILKTFKCTSIKLQSPTQWHHQHVQTVSTETLTVNRVLKECFLGYFTGKYCPPSCDKRTPQMPQFRVAEVEAGGQKKEDPIVIPSSKAQNQIRQDQKVTHMALWNLCADVCFQGACPFWLLFLAWHSKLQTVKYGKGKPHVTGYLRST